MECGKDARVGSAAALWRVFSLERASASCLHAADRLHQRKFVPRRLYNLRNLWVDACVPRATLPSVRPLRFWGSTHTDSPFIQR